MNMKRAVWAVLVGLSAAAGGLRSFGKEAGMGKGGWSEDELRGRLDAQQYRVVRENGTEPPFENAYWDNHEEGIYVDVVSGEPLFSSKDKFDSGTGWPSFTKPIDEGHVVDKEDRSLWMKRTEVRSKEADSHLGHVFDDGPAPAGKRYCINSAALRFVPAGNLEAEGYGRYASLFGKKGSAKTEKAVFAAGCFWGVEDAFGQVKGVIGTRVGYTGGSVAKPSYEKVCSGATGHTEAVEVEYDPARVSYADLLEVFWKVHDPTDKGGQGPDRGWQYRSAIFYLSEAQKKEALAAKERLAKSGKLRREVATAVEPAREFWPAEEYHQKYHQKHGRSCSL